MADSLKGANKINFFTIFQISGLKEVLLADNMHVMQKQLPSEVTTSRSSTEHRYYRSYFAAEFLSVSYKSPSDPLEMKACTYRRRMAINAICRTLTVTTSSVTTLNCTYSADHSLSVL
jgi:hypothetical protein